MKSLPASFNQEFSSGGEPVSGGLLYTYAAGTTTPQATFEDQAGDATNTNPIVLDADGRCDMWLEPGLEYTFRLERADETLVKTWDDVAGVASSGSAVTSVNELTGDVLLTADDIPFATGTSTPWFSGTDNAAAFDSIITKVNTLAVATTDTEEVIEELLTAVPPGAVQMFAMSSAPAGWLACNGALVSRLTYADLFSAIGTTYGVGDGVLTFGLPDLRGEFVRGFDNGRGIDAGRGIGSYQAQQVQTHKHVSAVGENASNPFGQTATQYVGIGSADSNNERPHTNDGSDYDGTVNAAGVIGTETRPRNVALLFCIRT